MIKLIEQGKIRSQTNSKEIRYIVLELAEGYSVLDHLHVSEAFDENMARYLFKQLLQGLEHCHKNSVYNRDIKSENLLFDSEFNLKISDFGFAHLS